jgi:UDP-N-acetylmuramate dehydrogenase
MIREHVPLAPYSSFRVGGKARYFVTVQTLAQLTEAVREAKKHHWPMFILGGGTNLIVADHGFPGLVIQLQIDQFKIENSTIEADTSVSMKTLFDRSIEAGLAGLKWAGGLPGTFGGAILGNAGAFGGEIKDGIESVTSFDPDSEKISTRTNTECQFIYRGSIFKANVEIIVSATVRLTPGDARQLRQTADDHIHYRQEKHPLEYPNAGSVFKNTPVEKVPGQHLANWVTVIKNDPFPVVPTAKIIADAGLKGLTVGQAQVSEKHTNYIVNLGAATATDIVTLIDTVRSTVKEKFQIDLEIEQQLVGF